MTKKVDYIEAERKRNEKLVKMVNDAREKVRGYEQLAKVHSAYIAILLQRLGADMEHPENIKAEDVKYALEHLESRASGAKDGSWDLFVEEVGGGSDGDIPQESASITREEKNQ